MATKTISRTDLVGLQSLSFIRNIRISFNITDTKPLTKMYAFFDGVPVGQYVTQTGGTLGGSLVTNAAGVITGTFDIPSATFNTGARVFLLQESSVFDFSDVPGSVVGSASAVFTTSGVKKTYQETITNTTDSIVKNYVTNVNTVTTNLIEAAPPAPPIWRSSGGSRGSGGSLGDPLAQTFFTYGITGGCFVTSIAVYFQSKDANLPVTLQIRNVVNGYPGPILVEDKASVSMSPSLVNISNNASVPTSFVFSKPIYLAEDQEYCFVLMANSNKYNMWTSKFGAKSIETGKTIFEQPFIGTMFKSENNITWSAEQTDDIKFTIYKAQFTTGYQDVTFKANAQQTLINGEDFSVTSGSSVVTAKFKFQHGHLTNDKIVLTGISAGSYRGISNAVLSNVAGYTVTVVDDYTLTFNCGAAATSTGTLAASGILNAVVVDTAGTGYVAPSITISGGGGTGATASAVVSGTGIVSVTVTSVGSGYTSTPTLVLSDASGTGAQLAPISEALFVVALNRKYQAMAPVIISQQPPQTSIVNTIRTSTMARVVGVHEIFPINTMTNTQESSALFNGASETTAFGTTPSTQMIMRLLSDNPNVSPIVDLGEVPKLRMANFLINSATNAASETSPTAGTAMSRYISKITTIDTPSVGIRMFVSALSTVNTSFDVFIRTSLSSSAAHHRDGNWVPLTCDVARNLSSGTELKEYEFYLNGMANFDVYDIKIVLYSENKYQFPTISNYRAIILAT